jgi:hypothetical protein
MSEGIPGAGSSGAAAIGAELDIVSADQHGAIGIEQASVQGSSEFYHLPMRIKYSS